MDFFFRYSSGVVWEEKKKKRFKALKVKNSNILELAYEQYAMECALGKQPASKKQLEAKMEASKIIQQPWLICNSLTRFLYLDLTIQWKGLQSVVPSRFKLFNTFFKRASMSAQMKYP